MGVKASFKGPEGEQGNTRGKDKCAQNMDDQDAEIDWPNDAFSAEFRETGIEVINDVKCKEKYGGDKRRYHHRLVLAPFAVANKVIASQQ